MAEAIVALAEYLAWSAGKGTEEGSDRFVAGVLGDPLP